MIFPWEGGMNMTQTKAIKPKVKREAKTPVEQTKPGLVFTPAVDIYETEKEIVLLADLPGVKAKDLNIDLRDNVLRIDAEVQPPEKENEMDVLREFRTGKYYREFSLSQVIDQSKIDAELKNGVLKLILPKVEAAKPRKIQIKTS
jgi:HSP20 family molecular chaperone IbpA